MEHTMNDRNRNNRARISALALSVAITMAVAIGLTTAANSPRGVAATDGGAVSLPSSAPYDDPELMRIDRGNVHHG